MSTLRTASRHTRLAGIAAARWVASISSFASATKPVSANPCSIGRVAPMSGLETRDYQHGWDEKAVQGRVATV